MYKNYSLSTFFLLIILMLAGVIGLISYGWRSNAPAQVFENNGKRYHAAFKQEGVDIYSPYYKNEASDKLPPRKVLGIKDKDGVQFQEKGLIDSSGYPGLPNGSVNIPSMNQNSTPVQETANDNQIKGTK